MFYFYVYLSIKNSKASRARLILDPHLWMCRSSGKNRGATKAGRTAGPEHHDIYFIMFTAVTCVLYTVFDIC